MKFFSSPLCSLFQNISHISLWSILNLSCFSFLPPPSAPSFVIIHLIALLPSAINEFQEKDQKKKHIQVSRTFSIKNNESDWKWRNYRRHFYYNQVAMFLFHGSLIIGPRQMKKKPRVSSGFPMIHNLMLLTAPILNIIFYDKLDCRCLLHHDHITFDGEEVSTPSIMVLVVGG